jgi:WD40 repeat protein
MSVAFNPDGERLATGSQDGTVRLWDVATGQEVLALRPGTAESLAFSPDGKCLAAWIGVSGVTVWEAP